MASEIALIWRPDSITQTPRQWMHFVNEWIQKCSTQILLLVYRMQMSVFYKNLKKHCLVQRCWYKLAKSFTSNGLWDSLIWKLDSITQASRQWMNLEIVTWTKKLVNRRNWENKKLVAFRTLKSAVRKYHFIWPGWPHLYGVTIPLLSAKSVRF